MKALVSALALAVLTTGLAMSAADAAPKAKKAKAASAATCTASPLMRDESRLWMCYPMKQAKK